MWHFRPFHSREDKAENIRHTAQDVQTAGCFVGAICERAQHDTAHDDANYAPDDLGWRGSERKEQKSTNPISYRVEVGLSNVWG